MSVILNFGDPGCLNQSAAGSLGAGIAMFARAGFPTVRGFVISPQALAEFLKRPDIAAALDLHRSGAEDPGESWRALKALFSRSRLAWNHEMDILTAYSGLGAPVSLTASSHLGSSAVMAYASSGEDALAGTKHCWLSWMKSNSHDPVSGTLPAVVVREMPESEVSVEVNRKGGKIKARAVFGLPEGLHDPAVSADVFEFGPSGGLERSETRPQSQQFVSMAPGPSRVPVAPDFRVEPKLSADMIAMLAPTIEFMQRNLSVASAAVCFVSSRPVVQAALSAQASGADLGAPPRQRNASLLEPPRTVRLRPSEHYPPLAMKIYLRISGPEDISGLEDTYIDGIIVPKALMSDPDRSRTFLSLPGEARRKLGAGEIVFEIDDTGSQTIEGLGEACRAAISAGLKPAVLMPGARSPEEMSKDARAVRTLSDAERPALWARVMYPSNLFFMDSMIADVFAVDTEPLCRLLLGTEQGPSACISAEALKKALEPALRSKKAPVAIVSDDIVSTPSFLEYLVRNGADILCPRPQELATARHIVASVEKRILMERGA